MKVFHNNFKFIFSRVSFMFKVVFSAFLMSSLFMLSGCNEDKKTNAIVVATSADYPPFEYYVDGKMTGFEIELMRMIGEELKLEVTFQDLPFDSIIGALQSKRVDAAITAMSATEERAKKIDFAKAHFHSRTVLLVDDQSSIKSIEDLKGHVVGVQMGSTYETSLKNDWLPKLEGTKIQSLTKVPDLIQDYKSKRITAIMLGVTEAEAIVKELKDLRIVEVPGTDVEYSIALPKDSELRSKINDALAKIREDGRLKTLEEKWMKGHA
jgi:polar amino acid transport system substrate-binding protein